MGKYAYLRPTADISLGHTCSTGSSGYAMIDEEEADDASTYIGQSTSSTSTVTKTSKFKLTGEVPSLLDGVIESAKLVIVHYKALSGTYAGTVSVSDEASNSLTFKSSSWSTEEFPITNLSLFNFGSNEIEVTFSTSISSSNSRKTAEARCTQIYIAVYYTAYYNLTCSLEMGHGLTADCPATAEWESDVDVKFNLENRKHILRALDNNTDVTSSVIYIEPSANYNVEAVSGASYGFALDSDQKYYVSQNAGQSNSYSLCKVNFNVSGKCTANIYVINYAEATYDYGILGKINETLSSSYNADSSYQWIGNTSAKNISTEQLVTYELPEGESFIYIKYRKDSATDSNNDNLQFRIELVQTDTTPYYGYDITNITGPHDLLIYTELPFIKISGTYQEAKGVYIKSNGTWVKQTDICQVFDELKNYEKGN